MRGARKELRSIEVLATTDLHGTSSPITAAGAA
jgi:hypothetical protein